MFEKASRLKLRFECGKGLCSVEDLWDLPLEKVDAIFKALNAERKAKQQDESLLETKSSEDETLELKVSIVRRVVEVRLQEKRDREDAAMKAERKQKLLAIIADKQDAELMNKSVEELTALVRGL